MEMTVAIEIAPPHTVVVFEPEPKGAENQEPENQPEPLPDSEEAIVEQILKNRILKRKLKVAVAVANLNGCHQALERERMDTCEETKRLKFHLLLGREALKKF